MNSIKISTVQTPSRFGMPTCGQAFVAPTRTTDPRGTDVSVAVRDRWLVTGEEMAAKGATKAHLGLIPSSYPGTSAWRPPIG